MNFVQFLPQSLTTAIPSDCVHVTIPSCHRFPGPPPTLSNASKCAWLDCGRREQGKTTLEGLLPRCPTQQHCLFEQRATLHPLGSLLPVPSPVTPRHGDTAWQAQPPHLVSAHTTHQQLQWTTKRDDPKCKMSPVGRSCFLQPPRHPKHSVQLRLVSIISPFCRHRYGTNFTPKPHET